MSGSREKAPNIEQLQINCNFCVLPSTRRAPAYGELYGVDDVLSMRMPSRFFVAQNIAPLGKEGLQFLLVPKTKPNEGHPISLAKVGEQDQLEQATGMLVDRLQGMYPNRPIFAFEHGTGDIEGEQVECGGCHVYHAHGNVLVLPSGQDYWSPMQVATERALESSGWTTPRPSERRNSTQRLFSGLGDVVGERPYLHMGMVYPNGDTTAVTYVQEKGSEVVASQLLRKIVAEVVHNTTDPTEWNWQDAVLFGDKDALRRGTLDFRTNEQLQAHGVGFASSPYSAGWRLYEAFERYGVTSLEGLTRIDSGIYEREVRQPNIEAGREFGREVRAMGHPIVIEPVTFHADSSQPHFTSFWRNTLLTHATVLYVNTGWHMSVGQSHEVGAALEKGVPIFVRGASSPLERNDVIVDLREGIRAVERVGADSSSLGEELSSIESYRRVRTPFIGGN